MIRRPASLHRVSPGIKDSPASTVLSGRYDSLPPVPPHFVSFAWRYHGCACVRFSQRSRRRTAGQGLLCPTTPKSLNNMETTGSPTFPGNPNCAYALFFDPGRTTCIRPLRCSSTAPAQTTTRAPTLRLSRLNSKAWALAVYASQHGLLHDHARLASGCWPDSTGRAWVPAGCLRKVSDHVILLS
jgi:hypothetical protein